MKNHHCSFIIWIYLNWLELEVSNDHADVVSAELEIRQVSNLRRVLLVSVVFLPSCFAFIHKGASCCFPVFVLVYEATHLS